MPTHGTATYCPTAQALHATHSSSSLPVPSQVRFIQLSYPHVVEQLAQEMSLVPLPSQRVDANMRLPKPQEAVHGVQETRTLVPGYEHGAVMREPAAKWFVHVSL